MAVASTQNERVGRMRGPEFVAILSMSMALGALAIDLMLPAFGDMRQDFGLGPDSTAIAGTVSVFLFGLALAQIVYGPFADRFGRKPVLYVGFGIYALGAVGAALAPTLPILLAARFVWGMGAAGARVVSVSMIRDVREGDAMARTMSFVMAVFLLVPIVAPTIGAAINAVANWRWIFGFCVVFVLVVAVWSLRLPETQNPADRLELQFDRIFDAGREVVSNRMTIGYTLAMTALFGAFLSYVASSEIIVSDVFGMEDRFPLVFGALAAVMGVAMLTNARIVKRFGARRLVHTTLLGYLAAAIVLVLLSLATGGKPPFVLFLVGFAAMLGMHALLIPNINTVAMIPMGHIAGTASAVIGTISLAGGTLLAAVIDRTFNGTITPLALGFLLMGVAAFAAVAWAEGGHLIFQGSSAEPAARPAADPAES